MEQYVSDWKETLNGLEEEHQRFRKIKVKYEESFNLVSRNKQKLIDGHDLVINLKKRENSTDDECKSYIEKLEKEHDILNEEIKKIHKKNINAIKLEYLEKEKAEKNKLQERKCKEEKRIASSRKAEEEKLQNAKNIFSTYESKLSDIEKSLEQASEEETQVLEFQKSIESDYKYINKNERLLQDYRDGYGVTKEVACQKYNELSDNEIMTISKELNENRYMSYPANENGLPIADILSNAFSIILLVLSVIWNGMKLIYSPVKKIRNFKVKAIITLVLLFIVGEIVLSYIDTILSFIILILGLFVLFVVGVLIFNIVKFSNRNKRIEQNLKYYTVGYYFIEKYNEIMYRISKARFYEMKNNSPDKFQTFLSETQGILQNERQAVIQSLEHSRTKLNSVAQEFDKTELRLKNDETQNYNDFETSVSNLEVSLSQEQSKKVKDINDRYKQENARSSDEFNNKKNNLQQELSEKKLKNKQKIEEYEKNKLSWEKEIENTEEQISLMVKEAEKIEENSRKWRYEADKAKITLIGERYANDKLEDEIFAGFTRLSRENSIIHNGKIISPYIPNIIKNNLNPIVIVFSGVDEEERRLTELYYTMIDFTLTHLLATKYYKAFKLEVIDNKGSVQTIKNSMQHIGENDTFEKLQNLNIIEIHCREKADKVVEKIIQTRQNELNGKNFETKNSENTKSDNMVKYIIMAMKIYNVKENDLTIKNLKQNFEDCKNSGIIPIMLISQSSFEKEKDNISLAIKEQCNGRYYKWNLDSLSDSGLKWDFKRGSNSTEICLETVEV